jgi:hypothetical protein
MKVRINESGRVIGVHNNIKYYTVKQELSAYDARIGDEFHGIEMIENTHTTSEIKRTYVVTKIKRQLTTDETGQLQFFAEMEKK